MQKSTKRLMAGGALCLCLLASTGTGECSVQSDQQSVIRQIESNDRNFRSSDKYTYEANKRRMQSEVKNRQRKIEDKKRSMEENFAKASKAYSMDATKTPSVQPYEEKKLEETPTTKPYTLPTQTDELSKVRKGATGQGTGRIESLPSGEGYEETASSSSGTSKERIYQVGIITGFLFIIMAGLRYIGRRKEPEEGRKQIF